MHDSAPSGYPIYGTGADHDQVSEALAVADAALTDVGDRRNAAVWVVGKTNAGSLERTVECEMVEKQKGIKGVAPSGPKDRRNQTPAPLMEI
jgi:hypothetical protein